MPKTVSINMSVEPRQHLLLTKAAALLHKNCSTFILEVACREAENVLLDQRFFHLNAGDFKAFDVALTAMVPAHAKLKDLLQEPLPWKI